LVKCLEQLAEFCGPERQACVARELTKIHEEIKTDTLAQLLAFYKEKTVKGEIVVVVAGQ
jgi:16S rRNA (cytidine1402-2'-O)-methyltransferase